MHFGSNVQTGLTHLQGVGDGIGRVWGLRNVQGLFSRRSVMRELRLVCHYSRRDGGIRFGRSRNVPQPGS